MKNNSKLVSIIIPTYNSSKTLRNCLNSIKLQTYKNIQIIVVDNKSKDTTLKIAKQFSDKVYNKGPERSAQRNFGAMKSSGDFLLFIDSDMELEKSVINDCVKKILNNNQINQVIIPERSFGTSFWASCKALERSFYVGVEWMEAARFFDTQLFTQFNGYDLNNTGTEDYDLPQRMIGKYGKSSQSRINSFINHNEGHLSLLKTLKKKYYYAQNLGIYKNKNENKMNFNKQVSILDRYKLFLLKPRQLFLNPIIGIGMLLMKTLEFLFGGLGYLKKGIKNYE